MSGAWGMINDTLGADAPASESLRIDPTKCTGIGMCSYVAPDLIDVDTWGFPLLPADLLESELGQARAAVAACPRSALALAKLARQSGR